MFLTLWSSCTVTDSQPRPRPHRRVALGSSRPQAASESVKVALSAAYRKASRATVALQLGTKVDRDEKHRVQPGDS
jgi:hypothetical protein